jgi:hypothetical protein
MFDVFAELVPGKEMGRPCLKSSTLMNFTDVVLPYISADCAWFSRLFSQVVSGKSPLGLWLWDMAKQRRSATLHFLGGPLRQWAAEVWTRWASCANRPQSRRRLGKETAQLVTVMRLTTFMTCKWVCPNLLVDL